MASNTRMSINADRIKADLTLLLVALIWGSAFVAQRTIADDIGVLTFNGVRFLIGALLVVPLARRHWQSLARIDSLGVLMAGLLLLGGAAFQQFGLRFTTAGNAGFVTGLYVVIIPIILAFGWRKAPRKAIWGAALLASTGLFLLSTGGRLSLALGDGLEFLGAVFFAMHVIIISWLVKRVHVYQLAVYQYFVCGLLSLLIGLAFETNAIQGWLQSGWSMLYTGVLSVGVGYTLQAAGQRIAPPADAAVILSMEAVFAALFGWLLLGELLTPIQLLGCSFMLAGMLLAQANVIVEEEEK
jgi:drug/metabolite transporter (DMT)-like permease